MMTWTELCQKNIDHYNEHPVTHMAIPVVLVAAWFGGVHLWMRQERRHQEFMDRHFPYRN